jgi:hypothetical protein
VGFKTAEKLVLSTTRDYLSIINFREFLTKFLNHFEGRSETHMVLTDERNAEVENYLLLSL